VIYKGHTIKVEGFRSAFVVNISGPLIPFSRIGTFQTKAAATVYAKEKIDGAHNDAEQAGK
jgi:hypothetical protein